MNTIKNEPHKKIRVFDQDLIDRIYRLGSKDAELMFLIVVHDLKDMEHSNVQAVNIVDLQNSIINRLITIENREG